MNGSILRVGALILVGLARGPALCRHFRRAADAIGHRAAVRAGAQHRDRTRALFQLPAPFETVTFLDNRILDSGLAVAGNHRLRQKRLVVDAFTRYRISDR